ncbi:MAG: hypothetical protein QXG05_03815, partial [Nitrososphaerota archaeon]
GAINMAKKFERALGYMPLAGAACEPAHNQPMLEALAIARGSSPVTKQKCLMLLEQTGLQ